MIRLFFFAAIPPLLIVLVWNDAPQAAIWAGWAVGAGILAVGWWKGTLVLKCPHCHKRVKMGAQTCHHCGQTVTNTAAPGYKRDPMSVPRECEHCKSLIRPDSTVCAICHRDVIAWSLHDGAWCERQPDGSMLRLNDRSLEWEKPA